MEVTNYLLTGMILQVPRKSDELATIKRNPTSYNKRGSLASSGVDSMDSCLAMIVFIPSELRSIAGDEGFF